jgi:uncharacterized protein
MKMLARRRARMTANQDQPPSATGLCRYGAPGWLQLERVDLAIPGFPPGLEQLTIGHMSDLHLSAAVGPELIAEAVATLNAQQPDLIAITGDFVTRGRRYLHAAAASVAPLRAPLGVYAVLGNHDYWCGAQELRALLAAAGVRVLLNEAVRLEGGVASVYLAGLDDALCERPDLAHSFAGVPLAG